MFNKLLGFDKLVKMIKQSEVSEMASYIIKKLNPLDYNKCNNIWEMKKQPKLANMFYKEIVNGNRITFVYVENNTFIGEGSLVFNHADPDYTIPNKRIYLSRLLEKNIGIVE